MSTQSAADALGQAKYVRLTTFRKDGTPVPTPVWLAQDGQALLVISNTNTGKVKRLRHTSRVLVAPCDGRGKVADGVQDVEGVATLDETQAGVDAVMSAIQRRYGFTYTILRLVNRLRRSAGTPAGIRITFPAA